MPFVICPTHLQKIHGIVGIVWRFLRNKNLGNFLWTGFMTPATAVPRFGSDLMELVVEAALSPQSWAGGMLKHVESCWNMLKWSEMWLDMTWCHFHLLFKCHFIVALHFRRRWNWLALVGPIVAIAVGCWMRSIVWRDSTRCSVTCHTTISVGCRSRWTVLHGSGFLKST